MRSLESSLYGNYISSKKLVLLIVSLALTAEIFILLKDTVAINGVAEAADRVLKICAEETYRPACYDKEIPKLMDYLTMEEAFAVAKVVQNSDNAYGYCHVLGHNLSAREAKKDIEKWADILTRCPSGVCSNGCLHGAAQARFRGEILTDDEIEQTKKEIVHVCDIKTNPNMTGLEQSECFHGLGHLTMYITNADIPKSIDLCNTITARKQDSGFTSLCYEGLFMQLFQPLEPEDVALVAGKNPGKEKLRVFCDSFKAPIITEACWVEGFILYSEEIKEPKGMVQYCAQTTSERRDHCYFMLYYVNAQSANYDAARLSKLCNSMPGERIGECFGHVANAIIHGGNRNIEKGGTFCNLTALDAHKQKCYEIIAKFARYNLSANTEEFKKLCDLMPSDQKELCLNNEEYFRQGI